MNNLTGCLTDLTEREGALVRFLWDAEEIINGMEDGLRALESDGPSLEIAERLYYDAYRIREGALAAELNDVSQLARVVENVFEHARRGQIEMTSDLISLVIPSCGALRRMLKTGVGAEERAVEGEDTPESDAAVEPAAVGE
jgi:chemotaxis protein histidine kinase CheA